MRIEYISSAQNAKIKTLLELQDKSKARKTMGLFVVEGRRELIHCLGRGYEADTVFWCPSIYGKQTEESTDPVKSLMDEGRTRIVEVSEEVYNKVAYRGGTEGVIAEIRTVSTTLEDLKPGENPLIVVLESVEKPGNLGAVLRSADAAGVDAVLICDPLTDLYNPNLIRSSLGGIFSVPCVACSSEDAINYLKANGIQILTAQLQDSEWYYDTDMVRPTAIVIGTESTGLTGIWREAADAHIRIPMLGVLDSLNASVSAAILMFEAVRQRNS